MTTRQLAALAAIVFWETFQGLLIVVPIQLGAFQQDPSRPWTWLETCAIPLAATVAPKLLHLSQLVLPGLYEAAGLPAPAVRRRPRTATQYRQNAPDEIDMTRDGEAIRNVRIR